MSVETVNCSQGGHLRGPYSDNFRPVGEKGPADHVTRQAHIPKTVFSLNIRRNSLGNVFYTSCFPCTVNGKTNVWQMWQRVTTITLLLPPVSDRTMVDCVFLKKKLKKTLEPETHYFSRPRANKSRVGNLICDCKFRSAENTFSWTAWRLANKTFRGNPMIICQRALKPLPFRHRERPPRSTTFRAFIQTFDKS